MIKFSVKQEPPIIDDVELINAVKQNEFLYNHKSADYRNLPLRATVWSSISKELNIPDRE